jgi:formate dehydrogenase
VTAAETTSQTGELHPANTKTVPTFRRYCLASCGIEVTVENNRVRKISADKENPAQLAGLLRQGRTANQLVEHPRRILNPMRRVGDSYVETGWDEAIADIAARMGALIEADGPDAIGVYYGNPAGFSSSNVVFMNAWMDAVGTHNRYAVNSVDQNSRAAGGTAPRGAGWPPLPPGESA